MRVEVVDRHHVVNPGDEEVLVRVKGKDQLPTCRTMNSGALDPANTAIAVLKGVFKRAAKSPEALIQPKARIQFPPVGEHFGTRADA
jgi:hypothetical protein